MFANVSTVRNVSSVLTQIRIDYGLGLGNYLALTDFSNLTFHPFYPDIRTQACLDTGQQNRTVLHQVDLTGLVQGRTIENIAFRFSAPQVRTVQWRT